MTARPQPPDLRQMKTYLVQVRRPRHARHHDMWPGEAWHDKLPDAQSAAETFAASGRRARVVNSYTGAVLFDTGWRDGSRTHRTKEDR